MISKEVASLRGAVVAAVLMSLVRSIPAPAAAPAGLAEARATGYAPQYHSVEVVSAAHEHRTRLATANPDSPELHCWVAYIDYRVIPRLMSRDKKQADRYCEDGVKHLDQAL